MTISHSEISTPPNNKRFEGASLPDNPSPAPEFLIGTKRPFPFPSSLKNFNRNATIATTRI
jgi:hypothetical protein